jgi:predicted enzyme related to lactoylglutathione lyase
VLDRSAMTTNFLQVVLRTHDVAAARAFYTAVLGERAFNIVQLHEQAVARGARPHWLGFLEVTDVERAATAFIERGAMALGPTWVNPEGLQASILRDPGGAIVAVAKPPAGALKPASAPDVSWYALNTSDVERAKRNYAELCGWHFHAPLELADYGLFFPFAWSASEAPIGVFGAIEPRSDVHPHWLFHFRVAALEPALAAVRAGGGSVLGPITVPTVGRIAVCDDPQGAAFALHECAPS